MHRSTYLGLAALLLWSATIALARHLGEQTGPLTSGMAVYLLAGLLLVAHRWLIRRGAGRQTRPSRQYLFGCGALFVIYAIALFLALAFATSRLQALEIGLVNYLWPALTLLLSLPILGFRAGLGLIPGTLLALAGVGMVLMQEASPSWASFASNLTGNPLAYGLGLVAAISWALYSTLTRRWGPTEGDGAVTGFILATGLVFGAMRLWFPETGAWTPTAVVEVLFLGMATAAAYVFWDAAMRSGDIVFLAACSYLTPLFSTVASCAYLRVMPGARLWAGCLLIIAGSIISWRSMRPAGNQ